MSPIGYQASCLGQPKMPLCKLTGANSVCPTKSLNSRRNGPSKFVSILDLFHSSSHILFSSRPNAPSHNNYSSTGSTVSEQAWQHTYFLTHTQRPTVEWPSSNYLNRVKGQTTLQAAGLSSWVSWLTNKLIVIEMRGKMSPKRHQRLVCNK